MTTRVDVAVVGAGAAGLAAARTLRDRRVNFVLLEASHRIGGRGYTEEVAPGIPFDLGCHWLHSGSINPFATIADRLGFDYTKEGFARRIRLDDRWASEAEQREYEAFMERSYDMTVAAAQTGRDLSVAEATPREDRWTPVFDYVTTLHHSVDADQVSVFDSYNYRDTGEDWPVKQGYGALIARYGADLPVSLNSAVRRIDWSGRTIRLETAKGAVEAEKVILTVSTGILGAGDIAFAPALPVWKQAAIAALPLGNHNRICLVFDRNVFEDFNGLGMTIMSADSEPMSFRIRPFGYDTVVSVTGGRFADWLERAGLEASADLAKELLKKAFGNDITKHIVKHSVTAWRGDPWVKGAYSAAQPGRGDQRAKLAEALDERLYFAGEATSLDSYATAHGAYLSGIATAEAAAAALGKEASVPAHS